MGLNGKIKYINSNRKPGDIFDLVSLEDILEEIQMDKSPDIKKVTLAPKIEKKISEEIKKRLQYIRIEDIIEKISKELIRKELSYLDVGLKKQEVEETIENELTEDRSQFSQMKEKMGELEDQYKKLLKRYEELKTERLNPPPYTFGGFPQDWSLINLGTTLNLGDPNTNGSWRIYVDGTNVSFQRRESDSWVEKGAYTP